MTRKGWPKVATKSEVHCIHTQQTLLTPKRSTSWVQQHMTVYRYIHGRILCINRACSIGAPRSSASSIQQHIGLCCRRGGWVPLTV